MGHVVHMKTVLHGAPARGHRRRPSFRERMRRIHERPPGRMGQSMALIPNCITISALCLGLWGMKLAMAQKWEWAVAAVVLAACLDAMDGRLARLLNASSHFGASLDMLSDLSNFGFVPAWIMYLFVLKNSGGWGWGACLLFVVCCALRLARFSTGLFDSKDSFCGLPSPAGAMIALAPLVVTFEWPEVSDHIAPWAALALAASGLLMISRVPVPAFKNMHLKPGYTMLALAAVGLLFAHIICFPWRTLLVMETAYGLATLGFALLYARRRTQARSGASQGGRLPPGP